ncbi:hypothetical protein DID80_05845 [Candidatus Marinamargulisbacteria bacterium SCGC AAA071-K20]|nr:hypothetical protein DID80_05845 [Candidatus Marinamargulisbacteria bacterium SCGC AAA071-K20]
MLSKLYTFKFKPLLTSFILLFIATLIALVILKKGLLLLLLVGLFFLLTIYNPFVGTVLFFAYIPFYNFIRVLLEAPIELHNFRLNVGGSLKDIFLFTIVLAILLRHLQFSFGKIKVNKTSLTRWFLFFVFLILINVVINFLGMSSLLGLRSYLQWMLLILLFANTIRTHAKFYVVLFVTQIISGFLSLVSIYQYYINPDFLWSFFVNSSFASASLIEVEMGIAPYRAISLFGHPNNLGLMLAIGAIISFNMLFVNKSYKVMNLGLFLLNFIGILTTGTRSSLVGLFLGIIIGMILRTKSKEKKSRLLLSVIPFIIAIIFLANSPLFSKRFSNLDILKNPRLLAWEIIYSDIRSNPHILITGRGIGYHLKAETLGTIDNSFIELTWEGGLITSMTFIVFVILLILKKPLHFSDEEHKVAILSKSILTTISFQMLTNSFLTGLFSIYFWFLVGYFLRFQCYTLQLDSEETLNIKKG